MKTIGPCNCRALFFCKDFLTLPRSNSANLTRNAREINVESWISTRSIGCPISKFNTSSFDIQRSIFDINRAVLMEASVPCLKHTSLPVSARPASHSLPDRNRYTSFFRYRSPISQRRQLPPVYRWSESRSRLFGEWLSIPLTLLGTMDLQFALHRTWFRKRTYARLYPSKRYRRCLPKIHTVLIPGPLVPRCSAENRRLFSPCCGHLWFAVL